MQLSQSYNRLLAEKLIIEFGKRNMEGFYCETKEEARQKALGFLPPGATVSQGGSETLRQIGLREALQKGDYNFLDPIDTPGSAKKDEIAHMSINADCYFLSANAITQRGELVNIDGYGNRVAALIFGPKQVVVIAGMNKVAPNLDAAILRAKTVAGVMIMLAGKKNIDSFDEALQAVEAVSNQLVITNGSANPGRIKIILVGENLGY